ncbi:MAG: TonB-dependent receptor [Acidobacteriota bacterium]|nr:TonB-dependent receptor [Acidobacteriota bacterium]
MPHRARLSFAAIVGFTFLLAHSPAWAAPQQVVRGTVKDRSGAVVARAQVVLRADGQEFSSVTQADGSFAFSGVDAQSATFIINAAGFATSTTEWKTGRDALIITLAPAPVQQSLDVTATRTAILPTGVDNLESQPDAVVVSSEQLQQWGALAIDDKLRNVAGFSLLRRSGSQTANPTSQGVSLRGLGASGASRALVLADGIPLNDPFGGWIYWARVPQSSLDQVQIVPGGVSALYGNDALGGVINLETRHAVQTDAFVEGSYGNENSPFGSGWGALRAGPWAFVASGEGFRTDGYVAVPQDVRGSVDTPVRSQYGSGNVRVERLFGDQGRMFLNGSLYGEDRHNGTPLQVNDTTIRQLAFGTDWNSSAAGLFTLRLFGGTENYHQTFSSVAADRNSESLTNIQYVPVQQMGLLGQWSKQIASRFTLLAGLDGLDVQGFSNETLYSKGKPTATLSNGGTQQSLGAFLEGIFQITHKWSVTFSGREDLWSNLDAHSSRVPVSGKPTYIAYPDRGQNAFNPRLSTSYSINDRVVVYAAGYRSFRAPTLNELYRSFRVGNVQTLANPYLRAEHFSGAEGGIQGTANEHISFHSVLFWGYTTDPVANVTLSSTPQLITRMRDNLGETRAWGFQAGLDLRITSRIALTTTYQYLDSTVVSFPADPTLVGNKVPLVPANEFVFQGTWAAPKQFLVAVQGRTASNEYDDDQNLLPLGAYFVLSATVSHPLPKGFDIFFQGENLTNDQYHIGRTPVVTLGEPILVRGGLRWQSRK